MNSTLQTSYRKEISEMFLESYARFSFHEYIWEDLTLLGTKNRVWISKDGVSVKLMQRKTNSSSRNDNRLSKHNQ